MTAAGTGKPLFLANLRMLLDLLRAATMKVRAEQQPDQQRAQVGGDGWERDMEHDCSSGCNARGDRARYQCSDTPCTCPSGGDCSGPDEGDSVQQARWLDARIAYSMY